MKTAAPTEMNATAGLDTRLAACRSARQNASGNMNLIIVSTVVRRDSLGRFSLNDLHRASGGEKRHQPAFFLRADSSKALVDEIVASETLQQCRVNPVQSADGRKGGTFVVKELVYAYAMWISPAFHLKVIRAYDASMSGALKEHDRARLRHVASASYKVMSQVIQTVRERDDKPVAQHHFIKEARLVNWALTGTFDPVDRDTLSSAKLDLLARLENLNSVLIASGRDYATRKVALREYAQRMGTTVSFGASAEGVLLRQKGDCGDGREGVQ